MLLLSGSERKDNKRVCISHKDCVAPSLFSGPFDARTTTLRPRNHPPFAFSLKPTPGVSRKKERASAIRELCRDARGLLRVIQWQNLREDESVF